MKQRQKITCNMESYNDAYFSYDPVSSCPLCKISLSPVYVASVLNSSSLASVINFCTGCNEVFITRYQIASDPELYSSSICYEAHSLLSSEPNRFTPEVFDSAIENLSPQFVKIYNQALAAETSDLDEIAGIGYRKALEFLVKDFAIHLHPEDEESIKKAPLAQCIKDYIDSPQSTTLAERSAWLGNDEAHYIRKHEDRSIADLKNFILAIVYFISIILITEDASSITPK